MPAAAVARAAAPGAAAAAAVMEQASRAARPSGAWRLHLPPPPAPRAGKNPWLSFAATAV